MTENKVEPEFGAVQVFQTPEEIEEIASFEPGDEDEEYFNLCQEWRFL